MQRPVSACRNLVARVLPRVFGRRPSREEDSSPEGLSGATWIGRVLAEPEAYGGNRADWPFRYTASARHTSLASRTGGLASDALVVTRFVLDTCDAPLLRFLGLPPAGARVFDIRAAGMELCWHSDLMQALERRCPIASRMTLHTAADDVDLEHLVVPVCARGQVTGLTGWFAPRRGQTAPSDVSVLLSVSRLRRGQMVSLPAAPLTRLRRR